MTFALVIVMCLGPQNCAVMDVRIQIHESPANCERAAAGIVDYLEAAPGAPKGARYRSGCLRIVWDHKEA